VIISILGEGATSRYPDREDAAPVEVEALRKKTKDVADLLGAKGLVTCGLPDNRFDTVPLLDVVKRIEGLIEQYRPSTVFTHSGGDLNIDHVVLHRAVLTATRPMAGQSVREIYAFEVASSTEWAFGQFAPPFRPGVFVDITGFLEKKVQAMDLYESEVRDFPHPRSPDALRAIARRWGTVVGLSAAEAFELVRQIR
jgi:LmbE family N-acetylglucosaminyl deacetylase